MPLARAAAAAPAARAAASVACPACADTGASAGAAAAPAPALGPAAGVSNFSAARTVCGASLCCLTEPPPTRAGGAAVSGDASDSPAVAAVTLGLPPVGGGRSMPAAALRGVGGSAGVAAAAGVAAGREALVGGDEPDAAPAALSAAGAARPAAGATSCSASGCGCCRVTACCTAGTSHTFSEADLFTMFWSSQSHSNLSESALQDVDVTHT